MGHRNLRPVETPDPPDTLSEAGARLWRDLTDVREYGTAELPQLRAYLEQLDTYDRCMERVRDEGPVVVNPATGNPKANPALAAAHAALRAARQTANGLGIDVSDDGFRPRGSLSRGRGR
jgi:phage terminase small subunit